MTEGNKYYLNETVRCLLDRSVYGSKGDEVTVISISNPVAIVEDSKGERFPVQMNKLSEEKIAGENSAAPVNGKGYSRTIKKSPAKKNIHQSLFK